MTERSQPQTQAIDSDGLILSVKVLQKMREHTPGAFDTYVHLLYTCCEMKDLELAQGLDAVLSDVHLPPDVLQFLHSERPSISRITDGQNHAFDDPLSVAQNRDPCLK